MMKRIISVLTVMAIMAAMLAVVAAPAFAGVPPPPNCEVGQAHAGSNAFARGDFEKVDKHGKKFFACARGVAPGEGQ